MTRLEMWEHHCHSPWYGFIRPRRILRQQIILTFLNPFPDVAGERNLSGASLGIAILTVGDTQMASWRPADAVIYQIPQLADASIHRKVGPNAATSCVAERLR